jgi:hypothetical protein
MSSVAEIADTVGEVVGLTGQWLTVLEDAVRDDFPQWAAKGGTPRKTAFSKERHRPPTTMSMATIHCVDSRH